MENIELFRMLEIPKEVEKQLINYGRRMVEDEIFIFLML